MPGIKYYPLFHLHLLHGYYADGMCKALQLIPSPTTEVIMRRHGLKFLPQAHGGSVYGLVDKAGSSWKLRSPLPDNLHLVFLLYDNASGFFSITRMPAEYRPEKLMVFNNLEPHTHEGRLLLVKDNATHLFGATDLMDPLPRLITTSKNSAGSKTASVTLLYSGQRYEAEAESYQGKVQASFNLDQADAGIAEVAWNDTVQQTGYLLPQPLHTAGPAGVVDILHRSSLPAAHRFMKADSTVTTRTYAIPFAPLSLKWRYRVQRRFNADITGVTVAKPSPGGIAFDTAGGAEPGEFICTSAEAVALSETPVRGVALRNQANKVLISHLPNPGWRQVVADTDGSLYADMLVSV